MEAVAAIIKGDKPAPSNAVESTFDRIDSPQYLNFDNLTHDAKDSYFEYKTEDRPAEQRSAGLLQKLPTDCGDHDDLIRCQKDFLTVEGTSITEKSADDIVIPSPSSDFGNELIRAVGTLRVNQVTSTPFRVKGVEPMPWRSPAKIDVKHCTIPKPFSFDERNKQILHRKARRMEMILRAEKEARKFRANPVPTFLKKTSTVDTGHGTSLNSLKKLSKSTESQLHSSAPPRFKARSPIVLRRPAFQPILPKQPLLPPEPFNLVSEIRAKEREAFDNFIREKERLDKKLKALKEDAQKRREDREMKNMRKKMVTKAQPIRKFQNVSSPVIKRPLTEPVTPRVVKRQRRIIQNQELRLQME